MTKLANALLGCVVFARACAVVMKVFCALAFRLCLNLRPIRLALLIMAALLSRDTDTHPDGRRDKLEAELGDEE